MEIMHPLTISNPSVFIKTKLVATRSGDGLPNGVRVGKRIGKGSNSAVYAATCKSGTDIVIRRPLHDSDTRKRSNAVVEAANTLIAANAGVSPAVYDIWYCTSGTRQQRRGLHVVMKRMEVDLHDVIFKDQEWTVQHRDTLARGIDKCAVELARAGLLTFDIKAGNVMLNKSPFVVRFVDFSNEYCERLEYGRFTTTDTAAPTLAHVASKVGSAKGYESVLRLTTLILLSASIATEIHNRRREHNLGASMRCLLNPLHSHMRKLRMETPAQVVRMVKYVLRSENVRECAEHYNNNRNACVRRLFNLSNFVRSDSSDVKYNI